MKQPQQDLEALFEAIVQPRQFTARQHRIDGILSRALAELAAEIPAGAKVDAFGGCTETVKRGAVSDRGVLIVDGVNLAARHARKEADALVSRMMRIRAAYSHSRRPVTMIVGYTASPGGLNGESHMRDWIETQLEAAVFDLSADDFQFREATRTAWESLKPEDPPGQSNLRLNAPARRETRSSSTASSRLLPP